MARSAVSWRRTSSPTSWRCGPISGCGSTSRRSGGMGSRTVSRGGPGGGGGRGPGGKGRGGAGGSDRRLWSDLTQVRVDGIADGFAAGTWQRASAGTGAKGPRWYDWAVRAYGPGEGHGWGVWRCGLWVRRPRERHDERAYYLCRGPAATPWRELVQVAGRRWAVEECFEIAKGGCGLEENGGRD